MLFSSITFLYFFLPITLFLYYVVPKRYKNIVLCLASFFFYAWGEPVYCILLFLYGYVAYVGGCILDRLQADDVMSKRRWIDDKRKILQRAVLVSCILIFLSGLFYFKYLNFLWENISGCFYGKKQFLGIVLPIGISFYTFQVISYIVDVYQQKVKVEKSFLRFLTYISMFPQLIAGPIVRYEEVSKQLGGSVFCKEQLADGLRRFIVGLSKKVLLADELGQMVTSMSKLQLDNPIAYWMITIGYMLQVYFDFSGYSDMAIGMGKMLGMEFPENFRYPLLADSVMDFWRRWHITLSRFIRDYIYIPLGGNRVSLFRWIVIMLLTWSISGIWHGAGWQFFLWGMYFGICLIIEKIVTGNYQISIPEWFKHTYTLFLVTISFAIFGNETVEEIIRSIQGLFCWKQVNEQLPVIWFFLRNYGILLGIAILAATPVCKKLVQRISQRQKNPGVITICLSAAWFLLCLFLSTAYLLNHSFHPFLYFRF